MGVIEILAAGKGHDELQLTENGAENKTKVDDLLAKRYSITVEVGEGDAKATEKATGFDGDTNEFLIDKVKTVEEKTQLRVSAVNAKATAVAPTAGG